MLRIAICDDSQLWLQKIETLTRGYLKKINVKYRLDLYQSGEKLLKSIASPYDIALLDVDLHSTNGIEVASQLRATNPQIVLIFVSEYVEYAPFGYEVDAIWYLLKNHLEQAFDRVMSEAVASTAASLARPSRTPSTSDLKAMSREAIFTATRWPSAKCCRATAAASSGVAARVVGTTGIM